MSEFPRPVTRRPGRRGRRHSAGPLAHTNGGDAMSVSAPDTARLSIPSTLYDIRPLPMMTANTSTTPAGLASTPGAPVTPTTHARRLVGKEYVDDGYCALVLNGVGTVEAYCTIMTRSESLVTARYPAKCTARSSYNKRRQRAARSRRRYPGSAVPPSRHHLRNRWLATQVAATRRSLLTPVGRSSEPPERAPAADQPDTGSNCGSRW
jgi:hypothetical protein